MMPLRQETDNSIVATADSDRGNLPFLPVDKKGVISCILKADCEKE